MSFSFYVGFFAALTGFVGVALDHGETYRRWKSSPDSDKLKNFIRLMMLWLGPVLGLVIAIASGFESVTNDREQSASKTKVVELTGQLNEALSNHIEYVKRHGPRTLTSEQLLLIKGAAEKTGRKLHLEITRTGSQEAKEYAEMLFFMLKGMGFQIENVNVGLGFMPAGISIQYPERTPREYVVFLESFSKALGYPKGAIPVIENGDPIVTIFVGDR